MEHQDYFVGRMNPIHLGHERLIDGMIAAFGIENSTVILGSSNAPTTLRHYFSYEDRRDFVRTLYPTIRVIGIPDYRTDAEWMIALDDLIESKDGLGNANKAQFYGGSQ
jgi:cytidyltransferase-like protein